MKNLTGCLAIALLGVGALPAAAEAPKDKGAAMPAPRPDPALETALGTLVGSWKCTGTTTLPPELGGATIETKSTMKVAKELDGFLYVRTHEMDKTDTMPAMKMETFWTHDAGAKKLSEVGYDNLGGTWRGTSKGLDGDKLVWMSELSIMGKRMKLRRTLTLAGDDRLTVVGERNVNGRWVKMGDDSCQK
jgi:hypothetical protein